MTDSLTADLAALLGSACAQLEWQRELGLQTVRVLPPKALASYPEAAILAQPAPETPPPAQPCPPVPDPVSAGEPLPEPAPVVAPTQVQVVEPTPIPKAAAQSLSLPGLKPVKGADPMAGPAVALEERPARLQVLQQQVEACTACRLHAQRTRTVFARGNPAGLVAFVGEGPGRDEDLQGLPFVGAAGQLLDKIIGAMGLGSDELYVCNVVKCRPPNNRVPMPDEMGACGPMLVSQLGIVRPQVIVALGRTAASYLLNTEQSMSKLRGRWHAWHGIPLLATWHPAYLLRTPEAKKDTWADMKLVLQKLGRTAPAVRS